jgi:tetratricopeptide (TPR) repeat protein
MWVLQGKHLSEAVAIFQAYLTLPQLPPSGAPFVAAHWRLGQAYEKSGRLSEALAEYQQASGMTPSLPDAAKDAERLKKRLGK